MGLGESSWTWTPGRGPVRGMEFRQRAAVKIWLGSFQCTSVSIKRHDASSGCKNIHHCPAQEPDFQVRALQAHVREALQNGVGGGSRWHHKEATIHSSGRKSHEHR